jgi:hypothetical protein
MLDVGASVAEWLRSLSLNNLPLTAVGCNPDRDFGWNYQASLLNVGDFKKCTEGHQMSSSTSKAGTSSYHLYSVGVT